MHHYSCLLTTHNSQLTASSLLRNIHGCRLDSLNAVRIDIVHEIRALFFQGSDHWKSSTCASSSMAVTKDWSNERENIHWGQTESMKDLSKPSSFCTIVLASSGLRTRKSSAWDNDFQKRTTVCGWTGDPVRGAYNNAEHRLAALYSPGDRLIIKMLLYLGSIGRPPYNGIYVPRG